MKMKILTVLFKHLSTSGILGVYSAGICFIFIIGFFLSLMFSCHTNADSEVFSPDGRIRVTLNTHDREGENRLTYNVQFKDQMVLEESPLGFVFSNGIELGHSFRVMGCKDTTIREEYSMPYGKFSRIQSLSNQKTFILRDLNGMELHVIFRVFDDGLGFRYYFPAMPQYESMEIIQELSAFNFSGDYTYWGLHLNSYTTSYEKEYNVGVLTEIPEDALIGVPVLLKTRQDIWISVTEAALLDYAGLYLQPSDFQSTMLESRLAPLKDQSGVCVRTNAPRLTPWRVIMITDHPGRLIESNLVLNLNDPPEQDFSWVKPGLAIDDWNNDQTVKSTGWEGAIDTRTMQHFIDFCADYGLDYMSIDAGWYGLDWSDTTLDLTKPIPEIDIPYLVKYANNKGVDVFLWTLSTLMKKQIDEVMPVFKRWGVKGFNVDFFDSDDQETVNTVNAIVEKAARNHFMVEFHGIYKPTGLNRTYPNLLAHEAVLGLEYAKWDRKPTPKHNCILPFTRMLAGPMDYIVVGFTNTTPRDFRIVWDEFNSLGTRCHHLAQLIIFETGFQVLGDYPDNYRNSFGSDLFGKVTVSWDDTRVLDAIVGNYLAMARRKGEEWFVGTITDESSRTLNIPLAFLEEGTYKAEMYSDTEESNIDPRLGKYETFEVTNEDTLNLYLASGGGNVIRIFKE